MTAPEPAEHLTDPGPPGTRALLREPAHRVSPRARAMWGLAAATEGLVMVAVAVVLVITVDALGWWLPGVVALLVVGWVVVVPRWRYAVHRWEVTESAVYTQSGWWVRERRIAPLSRIQTVDQVEGAVARLFGLASVTVTTASAAGAISIVGLDRSVAVGLVAELTRQADAVEGDAT